jgi:hypothetical protein
MWLCVSTMPGEMMPFVSITVAPLAFGIAMQVATVSTHVMRLSSTSTAPSSCTSGVTTVPINRMWFGAPTVMVTSSGLGASAPGSGPSRPGGASMTTGPSCPAIGASMPWSGGLSGRHETSAPTASTRIEPERRVPTLRG